MSLLEAVQGALPRTQAPALRNCFNSGVCKWLCAHRRGLQWALGLETLALLALLAFYTRLNRALARQQPDEDDDDDAQVGRPLLALFYHGNGLQAMRSLMSCLHERRPVSCAGCWETTTFRMLHIAWQAA